MPLVIPEGTDPIIATAVELLNGAEEVLSNPVKRVSLSPGLDVAWDECCGQLTSRVVNIASLDSPGVGCNVLAWDVTYGLAVVRCVSTADQKGRPPKAQALTDDAIMLLTDMREIADFLRAHTGAKNLQWQPLGPDGGCASGEWTFRLRVLPG